MAEDETIFFPSAEAFRAWLAEHGGREDALWVGFHRKGTGVPSMTWAESVDEALCFGWIDSVRHKVDDGRYRNRFTRRRAGSNWSKRNIERVAALKAEGRMEPPGLAAYEGRSEERSGTYSFERGEPAVLPVEYQRRLEGNAEAWTFFQAQPAGYRNVSLHWVMSAKREETRERRLQTLIDDAAAGLRIKELGR
jgi:uncharacterized protein YdeI (YjbR/CyaY-like superfamily)